MIATEFVKSFINEHLNGISTIFNTRAKHQYPNLESFIQSFTQDLVFEYDRALMKGLSEDQIKSHLFYLINSHCKPANNSLKKDYICPGCLFLGKTSVVKGNHYLKCDNCALLANSAHDEKEIVLYKTFSKHTAVGYKCPECQRFIPKNNSLLQTSCPYFDCLFVGDTSSLKKMRHPISQNEQILITKPKQKTISQDNSIKNIIEFQLNNLLYTSCSFTLKHKVLVYQAILQLLDDFPEQMTEYLTNNSRTGGFQHKIFQKYISLLESSFPFVIKKNNKVIRIDNLLDPNLSLFDGISTFEGIVTNGVIKNNTQEYYIGGRLANHNKPYYIGKLLNIVKKDNKESLMDKVIEYTFCKIKVNDIVSNTPVIVTHLRVPPHYQMGGMVYVNRIRKNIVDQIKSK